MAVVIGHASIDERGKVNGGQAGDQTGKEVCTRNWYNKPWTVVFRPKNSNHAEKIAYTMEQACKNDNIGYDQYQRTTLYNLAKECNFDLSKITTKCETDCSALVSVCVNAAGITVSKDMYTGNQEAVLKATNKFEILKDDKYLNTYTALKRGDILLGKGHTAIVLFNTAVTPTPTTSSTSKNEVVENKTYDGKEIGTAVAKVNINIRSGSSTTYKSYGSIQKGTKVKVLSMLNNGWFKIVWTKCEKGYAYTYYNNGNYYDYTPKDTYVTTANLHLRKDAGTNSKSICVIPKGSKVVYTGDYKTVDSIKWFKIMYNNKTGYSSSKYLKK